MEHHPSLRELTVIGECSESLVKGTVEGMARRHGVEKLVVTLYNWEEGECDITIVHINPFVSVFIIPAK